MTDSVEDGERAQWKLVGERVRAARQTWRPKVSIRAAALRAGMSEGWWRHLEAGERPLASGITAVMNPSDGDLLAACRVVGLDPAEIFAIVNREVPIATPDSALPAKAATYSHLGVPEDLTDEERAALDMVLEGIWARRGRHE